jgi:Tfp pilus assembly protein PilF
VKYLLIFVLLIVTAVTGLAQAGPSSSAARQPVEAAPAQSTASGGDRDSKTASQSNDVKQTADPAAALEFLGSYSAPQAVLATETGHTSSRPPSVAADRRLADLGSDLGEVPADPAEARRQLVQTLSATNQSPDAWFRAATAALGAARADSRKLAEIAPSGDWNRRFQAEALAARYPLIARSLWSSAKPADPSRSERATPGVIPAAEQLSPSALSRWRDELADLNSAAESPETLYRRARLLVEISGAAYKLAAASPALDARLFALQALAAEEENDEGAALEEYRAGLAKYPQSGLLHAGLGHLYRERNQLEAARAELTAAGRQLPSDPLVAFDLGDVELRMGEPTLALEMLNHALDLDSSLLVARWSRGRAYTALGGQDNDQRALEDLEAAVTCDSSGVLQWQLGQLYAKLGRNQEAREAEQKSLDLRHAAEQQKRPAEVKSP